MGLHHVFNSNTISHVHALAFLKKKKKTSENEKILKKIWKTKIKFKSNCLPQPLADSGHTVLEGTKIS